MNMVEMRMKIVERSLQIQRMMDAEKKISVWKVRKFIRSHVDRKIESPRC